VISIGWSVATKPWRAATASSHSPALHSSTRSRASSSSTSSRRGVGRTPLRPSSSARSCEALALVAAVLLLPACGGRAAKSGGRLPVVAAENVYGNMASQIGGSRLAVAGTRVVIQNGVG